MLVYLHFTDKLHIMTLIRDVNYQKVLQYAIELQEPFTAAQVVTSLKITKHTLLPILQKLTDVNIHLKHNKRFQQQIQQQTFLTFNFQEDKLKIKQKIYYVNQNLLPKVDLASIGKEIEEKSKALTSQETQIRELESQLNSMPETSLKQLKEKRDQVRAHYFSTFTVHTYGKPFVSLLMGEI